MTTPTVAERDTIELANFEVLAERGRAMEPEEPTRREQMAYAKDVVDGVEAFIEQTRSGIGIGVTGDSHPRIITIEVVDAAK